MMVKRRFAQDTDVPIDRTRLELEELLRAYKARRAPSRTL
jgi:hypothetical protein